MCLRTTDIRIPLDGKIMRKLAINIIVILNIFWFTGCDIRIPCDKKGYGYITAIKTEQISPNDLQQLETLLLGSKFSKLGEEREAIGRGYPHDAYITYLKKLSDKPHHFVEIYIFYTKNPKSTILDHIEINVENSYRGSVIPEIKAEIERYADLIYQHLKKTVKEPLTIENKVVTPPMCL